MSWASIITLCHKKKAHENPIKLNFTRVIRAHFCVHIMAVNLSLTIGRGLKGGMVSDVRVSWPFIIMVYQTKAF